MGIHACCCWRNMVVGWWCLIYNKPIWCNIRHVHGLLLIRWRHLMKSPQIVYKHETNNSSLQPLNLDYHLLGGGSSTHFYLGGYGQQELNHGKQLTHNWCKWSCLKCWKQSTCMWIIKGCTKGKNLSNCKRKRCHT